MEASTFLKRVKDDLCLMYLLLTSDKADDNTNKQKPEQIFGRLTTNPLDLYFVMNMCMFKYKSDLFDTISKDFMKRIIVAKNLLNTKPGPFNSNVCSPPLSKYSKTGLLDIISQMFFVDEEGSLTIFREPATSAGILMAMMTEKNIQKVAWSDTTNCSDPFHCRNFISLLSGIVDSDGNESGIVKSLKRSCHGEGLEKIVWFGDGAFVDHSRALAAPNARIKTIYSLFIACDVNRMVNTVLRVHVIFTEQSGEPLYERGLSHLEHSKFCETISKTLKTLTLPENRHREEERYPSPTLQIKGIKVNGLLVSDIMSHPKLILRGDTVGSCGDLTKTTYSKAVCIVFGVDRETGTVIPFRYLSIGDKEFFYSDDDYCQGTGCTSSGQPILRASNAQNSGEKKKNGDVSVSYRLRDENVDPLQKPKKVDLYCSYITTFERASSVWDGPLIDCLTAFSIMSGKETMYTGEGNGKRVFEEEEVLAGRVKVSKNCSISFSPMDIICFGRNCGHYGFFDFLSILDFMINSDKCPVCSKELKYGDLVIVDPFSFEAHGIHMVEIPDSVGPSFNDHFYYYESEGTLSQEPLELENGRGEGRSQTEKRQAVEGLNNIEWIEL